MPYSREHKARTRAQAAFIPELQRVPWANRVHFHFSDENRQPISRRILITACPVMLGFSVGCWLNGGCSVRTW